MWAVSWEGKGAKRGELRSRWLQWATGLGHARNSGRPCGLDSQLSYSRGEIGVYWSPNPLPVIGRGLLRGDSLSHRFGITGHACSQGWRVADDHSHPRVQGRRARLQWNGAGSIAPVREGGESPGTGGRGQRLLKTVGGSAGDGEPLTFKVLCPRQCRKIQMQRWWWGRGEGRRPPHL